MKAIDRRIRRLQSRLCPDNGQPQRLWVTVLAGREFALDLDRCTEILGECGFLPSTRFGVLSFFGIPDGLNAKELKRHLRRYGAQICSSGRDQKHVGQGGAFPPGDTTWSNDGQMSAGVLR